MRVVVDYDRCDSNGLCAEAAPDIFELDDEDVLHVLEHPRPDSRPAAEQAARVCPKLAISLVDAP